MDTNSDEEAPPQPGDVTAWRAAIANDQLAQLRPEDIVAAVQFMGPNADKAVLNPLAKHLSDLMLKLLRARVGRNHPNKGHDIIERVHDQLWDAILRPDSPDGKGLRTAFFSRLTFRLKDALIAERRARVRRTPAVADGAVFSGLRDHQPTESFEPAGCRQVEDLDEQLDVDSALETITDPQKRLAFRLFMDGLPYKSTRSDSIAEALGISEKTAREWIAETQQLLKQTMGDRT